MATLIYLSQIHSYYIRGDRSPLTGWQQLFHAAISVNRITITNFSGPNVVLDTKTELEGSSVLCKQKTGDVSPPAAYRLIANTQLTRVIHPMLFKCWASVEDGESTLKQHNTGQCFLLAVVCPQWSPRHTQNPLSGEQKKTLSITHHALSPHPHIITCTSFI